MRKVLSKSPRTKIFSFDDSRSVEEEIGREEVVRKSPKNAAEGRGSRHCCVPHQHERV